MNWIKAVIDSAGGQRFFMAMGAGIVDTALLIRHYIDPTVYRDLTLGTVGVFIAAATAQKMVDMRSARAAGQQYEENPGV